MSQKQRWRERKKKRRYSPTKQKGSSSKEGRVRPSISRHVKEDFRKKSLEKGTYSKKSLPKKQLHTAFHSWNNPNAKNTKRSLCGTIYLFLIPAHYVPQNGSGGTDFKKPLFCIRTSTGGQVIQQSLHLHLYIQREVRSVGIFP